MNPAENHLIELLPKRERQRLLARCEPVQLLLSEVLSERGELTRHAYFPVDGVISLLGEVDGHPGMEVGMVGREGMLGLHLWLGVPSSPLQALVQGPGRAWRIGAASFMAELQANAGLADVLKQYTHVSMAQLANAAVCLRFHMISPRLARWLLMSQDRAHADSFHVTHEFLAYMLGVRRVGITMAAGALHRAGLIEYHRGKLTVLDRCGLEAAACSCYASDLRTYDALLV